MATSGGFTNPCPAQPMTHAAVVALRDAGLLRTECVYVISDWVQGTTLTGPNLVELHAVSANRLSMEAKVTTPSDQVAWVGQYDIDQGALGTMQELRDNLGNIVRDSGDGATVGAFPWGAANFSNNVITDATLTSWSAMTGIVSNNTIIRGTVSLAGNWTEFSGNYLHSSGSAAAGAPTVTLAGGSGARVFNGNTVRDGAGYRDTAGGTGTRTITDNEFLDGFFADITAGTTGNISFDGNRFYGAAVAVSLSNTGSGNRTFTRSVIKSANNGGFAGISMNSSGTVTVADSTFNGGRISQSGAPVTGTLSVTGGSVVTGSLTQTAGATGGGISVSNTNFYNSNVGITQAGPGQISLLNSQIGSNVANNVAATRGLTLSSCVTNVNQISTSRSGGTGTDTFQNSRIEGAAAQVQLFGAVDPGMNQTIADRCSFSGGYNLSITDPVGASQFSKTEISSGANITATGTGTVTACRFAAGCTVNLGAFSHANTVIEGAFTKNLTAANNNRLCSKAFDDVI